MRIVEANLNLRIEKGHTNRDYAIRKEIVESLLNINPVADIYTMVEYMQCQDEEFLDVFSQNGYVPTKMLDKNNRGILIEIKKDYSIEKKHELYKPHLLHLEIKKENKKINLIVLRILAGKYCNEKEFSDRKDQFEKAFDYIRSLNSKQIILTGDFNNARIRDDYTGYAQKCYNYQWIVKRFKDISLELVPVKGYSHKGYLKEDHIILGNSLRAKKAEYETDLFDDRDAIGYPDHVPLIADIEIDSSQQPCSILDGNS